MTRTLTTEGGRSVLRMERRLRHPVEKVWRAMSEPGELGHWFPTQVELELVVGGKVRFIEASDEYPSLDGEITDLDPPRLIAYTWDDDHLRWELRPDGAGTLLTLTHTFADRYGAPSFASGWTGCLDALDLRLSGRLAGPDNPDGVAPEDLPGDLAELAELHERLIEEFGLDEGVARRTDQGWTVRFERQMILPADAVWDVLTGGAPVAVGDTPPARSTAAGIPAGPVTDVEAASHLEYAAPAPAATAATTDGEPAGRVRFELSPGAGGARLVVTHTIPTALADQRSLALDAWRTHLRSLAADLRELPPAG